MDHEIHHEPNNCFHHAHQGLTFSAEDVLEMTRKTRALLPKTPLSVTVPHTLDLDEQARRGRAV